MKRDAFLMRIMYKACASSIIIMKIALYGFFDTLSSQEFFLKGLPNVGNTCYLNSVLQATRSLDIVTDFLLSEQAQGLYKEGSIGRAYVDILKQFKEGKKAVDIRPFVKLVGEKFGLRCGKMQDTLSFQSQLFNALAEDDLLDEYKKVILYPGVTGSYLDTLLRSVIKVDSDLYLRSYIPVDLMDLENIDRIYNLQERLFSSFKVEFIARAPYYLVIQNSRGGGRGEAFRLKIKNLRVPVFPFLNNDSKEYSLYDLKAVVADTGVHAVAYARYTVNGSDEWYYFNDSSVGKKNSQEIEKFETDGKLDGYTPLIMFYEFRSTEKIPVRQHEDLSMQYNRLATLQVELEALRRAL